MAEDGLAALISIIPFLKQWLQLPYGVAEALYSILKDLESLIGLIDVIHFGVESMCLVLEAAKAVESGQDKWDVLADFLVDLLFLSIPFLLRRLCS